MVWFNGQSGGVMNGRLLFNGDTVYAQGPLRVAVGSNGSVATAPSFVGWIQESARCGSHWIFVSDANVIAVSSSYLGPLRVVGHAGRAGMAPHFAEDGERALLLVGREAFEFDCDDEVVVRALPQRTIMSATRGHEMTVVVTNSAAYVRRDSETEWHRLDLGQDAVRMAYATVTGLILSTSSGEYSVQENSVAQNNLAQSSVDGRFTLQASRVPGAHYSFPSRPSPERFESDRSAMRDALRRDGLVPRASRPGPAGSVAYCTPMGPEVRFAGGGTVMVEEEGCRLSGLGEHLSFRSGTQVLRLHIDPSAQRAWSELLFTHPDSSGGGWLGGELYSVVFDGASPCGDEECLYDLRTETYSSFPTGTTSYHSTPAGPLYRQDSRWFLSNSTASEDTRLPRAFDNAPTVAADGSVWTHRLDEAGLLTHLLLVDGDEVLRRSVPEGMAFYAVRDRQRLFARDHDGTEFWRSVDGGDHWTPLETDTRVDGLFQAGPRRRGRGSTCGEPCFWWNVVIGSSAPAYSDQRLVGSRPWVPIALPHFDDDFMACETATTPPLSGAASALFSRRGSRVTWRGVDENGVFRSRSRAPRHTGEHPNKAIWLFQETALVQASPERYSLGSSLRWLGRNRQEVELVPWAASIDTILQLDGRGVALSDDSVMERRRAFAWDDKGEVLIERFVTSFSDASVAWVDGQPAVFLTDDPWGDRLRGDIVFLDPSRESETLDLELRATLCSDIPDADSDADLISAPGPQRWGLTSAVVERRGEHTCLRAARGGSEGDTWNGWVRDTSLLALVPAERVQRVHLVPAVSAPELFGFARWHATHIAEHCASRDEGLAGSGTVFLARDSAPRWEQSTFSNAFEACAVERMARSLPEGLDMARMNLSVVPASATLRPSTCTFRSRQE